eukprot:CAMPEP_0196673680 /NCGR_PEP_ID=MMETSP1090-20130531/3083_1 /TAXON_ID=37098 /ORGANISM="Isochrysis sp, Strain CCMP1244" /LENGTH=77 /DNA_ID=CAMNT_0042011453 /DNA_START=83 /DNA_END=316 /DNA_ORIENTATION=-
MTQFLSRHTRDSQSHMLTRLSAFMLTATDSLGCCASASARDGAAHGAPSRKLAEGGERPLPAPSCHGSNGGMRGRRT